MCVKDFGFHSQKYWYQNFVCMFSWLNQFFSHRNKKINTQTLKYGFSCIKTDVRVRTSICMHGYESRSPWWLLCNSCFHALYPINIKSSSWFSEWENDPHRYINKNSNRFLDSWEGWSQKLAFFAYLLPSCVFFGITHIVCSKLARFGHQMLGQM